MRVAACSLRARSRIVVDGAHWHCACRLYAACHCAYLLPLQLQHSHPTTATRKKFKYTFYIYGPVTDGTHWLHSSRGCGCPAVSLSAGTSAFQAKTCRRARTLAAALLIMNEHALLLLLTTVMRHSALSAHRRVDKRYALVDFAHCKAVVIY